MKNSVFWKLSAAFAGCLSLSFSAMAAVPAGTLEGADQSSVYGWVWDSDNYNHIIPVEISFYPAGSDQILKTDIIKADDYQDKLQESIGDGYHGFLYSVDWNQFQETLLRVTASTAEEEPVFLGELTYNKETGVCTLGSEDTSGAREGRSGSQSGDSPDSPSPIGPGADGAAADPSAPGAQRESDSGSDDLSADAQAASHGQQAPEQQTQKAPARQAASASSGRGPSHEIGPGVPPPPEPPREEEEKEPEYVSLGMFVTTGYCGCEICCPSGSSLTYSGTVPRPAHTISADITAFPIGTRLMINGVIYTVEDIGSQVTGNKIDIYYATHEEALDHGVQEAEVFAVPDDPAEP